MIDARSDLLHAQYRLSVLLVTAMCGAFNAVLLQEAQDHVPHISTQFDTCTDGDGLAILLNTDTFLPDAVKFPITEESTSKSTWSLTALVVRGLLRRPTIGAPPTLTLCSVDPRNVFAKKRDAATVLLRRLRAHMVRLDVDIVGGDFNMAVNGPVADALNDAEFMTPGSSPLWRASGLEGAKADCMAFLCMPRRPFHWRIHKHGVHTSSNDQLGLAWRDEGTHHPVFMHLLATNLTSGTLAVLRSDAAQTQLLLKVATMNDRKRQRGQEQATAKHGAYTTSTSSTRKLQSHARPYNASQLSLHAPLLRSCRPQHQRLPVST